MMETIWIVREMTRSRWLQIRWAVSILAPSASNCIFDWIIGVPSSTGLPAV